MLLTQRKHRKECTICFIANLNRRHIHILDRFGGFIDSLGSNSRGHSLVNDCTQCLSKRKCRVKQPVQVDGVSLTSHGTIRTVMPALKVPRMGIDVKVLLGIQRTHQLDFTSSPDFFNVGVDKAHDLIKSDAFRINFGSFTHFHPSFLKDFPAVQSCKLPGLLFGGMLTARCCGFWRPCTWPSPVSHPGRFRSLLSVRNT